MNLNLCSLVFISFTIVLGSRAIKIHINPERVAPGEKAVQISCLVDEVARSILFISVIKNGNRAIAHLQTCGSITYGDGYISKFEADGQIADPPGNSFLKVVLINPQTDDSGVYACKIIYRNESGFIKEDILNRTLFVEGQNMKSVLVEMKKEIVDNKKEFDDFVKERSQDLKSALSELKREISNDRKEFDAFVKESQDMKSVLMELKKHITNDRKEFEALKEQSQDMKSVLMEMKKDITNDRKEFEALKEQSQDMKSVLMEMRKDITNDRKEFEALKEQSQDMKLDLKEMREDIVKNKTQIENQTQMSAFSATNKKTRIFPSKGRVLIFPDMIMSQGEGYDPKTGIFTAPRDGLYSFHLVVRMASQACYVRLKLEANDKLLVGLTAGDTTYGDQSTVSSVVKLLQRDTVKVVVAYTSGGPMYGQYYSVFSGYFIYSF